MAKRRDRRLELIDLIAAVLAAGEPTYFAFEGTCRHGLRSMLCLEGHRWARADFTAEQIVAAALELIGAKRPTWQEGQPDYANAEPRTFCTNPSCRKVLSDANRHRRFCSALCKRRFNDIKWAMLNKEAHAAKVAAQRLRKRAQAEPRPCEYCKDPFQPYDYNPRKPQRYCSQGCKAMAQRRKPRKRPQQDVP